ncbi:MAG: 4Fe-4S dicluster domain-containing protein, partial [Planctomycetes bacterium]|nr:4Fe-4S dicluster domain-containing protein [Planctomycetota bacterium]
KGNEYLAQTGVAIQPLSKDVVRDEEKCVHCGSCVVLCTGGALSVERPSMKVDFDHTKCIACEICVRSCPSRAMEIRF